MRDKYKRKKQRQQALPRPNVPPVPASTNQESTTKEQSKTEIDHRNNKAMRGFKVTEFLKRNYKLILESVAVIAAIAVLVVYALQLRVMHQTEKIDQRAWVNVITKDVAVYIGQPITSELHFANTGKTPAGKVEGRAVIKFLKVGEELKVEDLTYERGTALVIGTLFPNEADFAMPVYMPDTHAEIGHPEPAIGTREMLDAIQAKTSYFVIYGRLTYNDVLGNSHWITFCSINKGIDFTNVPPCLAYSDFDHE